MRFAHGSELKGYIRGQRKIIHREDGWDLKERKETKETKVGGVSGFLEWGSSRERLHWRYRVRVWMCTRGK